MTDLNPYDPRDEYHDIDRQGGPGPNHMKCGVSHLATVPAEQEEDKLWNAALDALAAMISAGVALEEYGGELAKAGETIKKYGKDIQGDVLGDYEDARAAKQGTSPLGRTNNMIDRTLARLDQTLSAPHSEAADPPAKPVAPRLSVVTSPTG